MKNLIINIIEDIEPYMDDDSGYYIPRDELDKAAELILELWEFGHTWETKKE